MPSTTHALPAPGATSPSFPVGLPRGLGGRITGCPPGADTVGSVMLGPRRSVPPPPRARAGFAVGNVLCPRARPILGRTRWDEEGGREEPSSSAPLWVTAGEELTAHHGKRMQRLADLAAFTRTPQIVGPGEWEAGKRSREGSRAGTLPTRCDRPAVLKPWDVSPRFEALLGC